MKEKFIKIYRKYITRPGAEDLLAYLEKSDFFRAPASHKHHLSIPGGLCMHSIGVYERLRRLYIWESLLKGESGELTPEQEETIAICGLLHDLCKIDFYQSVKKSRKTGKTLPNGKPEWEDYYGYDIEEKLVYGHGEKSVYIASGFMRLTREEAIDIALKHAGLNADQVRGLEAELDRDDGRLHYDVDFEAAGYDYDYEIDTATGEILKSQKERD